MKFEEINNRLYNILLTKFPEELKRVSNQEMCDIDSSFLGFVDTYYHLSKIIHKDWVVVDLGCAYAPQGYYFRNHTEYIGVNPEIRERFTFKNTKHLDMTIQEFMKEYKDKLNFNKTFAIMNYVPPWHDLDYKEVRSFFPNLYCFYP